MVENLTNLDYTAYEHVKNLEESMEDNSIEEHQASIEISYSYQELVPTVEYQVSPRTEFLDIEEFSLNKSYSLDGVTPTEFEEIMYDVWVETTEDTFLEAEVYSEKIE